MYPFKDIFMARTVGEALAFRRDHPEAVYIAGGSDVLVALRNGRMDDACLISLYQIDELRGITLEEDGTLLIRPLTSFTDLNESAVIAETAYLIGEAAGVVGGPQIRNIGTVGGNICNGVTSADTASTLLAYDAYLEVTGLEGVRTIPMSEWYIKAKQVALKKDEILTAIRIPEESWKNHYGKYIKFSTRRAMDIATLGCSLNLALTDDRKCLRDLRIAFGVAGPVPMRLSKTEKEFGNAKLTKDLADRVARMAVTEIHPRSSWRASAEFRLELAEELVREAFLAGLEQASERETAGHSGVSVRLGSEDSI